jgi:signal transduction histidine kinase
MSTTTTSATRVRKRPRESAPRVVEPLRVRCLEWGAFIGVVAFLSIRWWQTFPQVRPQFPQLVAWVGLVVVTDLLPVPLWGRLTLSLSLPILLAAGMLYAPHLAGAVALVGSNDPREFRREVTIPHGLYNRSQIALSTIVASAIFHTLGGSLLRWPAVVGVALVAVIADMLVNLSLVVLPSKLEGSKRVPEVLKDFYGGDPAGFLSSYICFGLVALLLAVVFDVAGGWGMIAFSIPVFLSRQVFVQSRRLRDMAEAISEKTRLLLSVSEKIAEERRDERLSIAAGLHDEILPPLYNVHLMGQVIRQDLATGQLLALEDDIPDLLEATEKASDAMRVVIGDLKRSPLGRGGLSDTLALLVKHLRQESSARIHIGAVSSGGSPVVQLLAYQVAREALKNSIRHSRASNIWVEVSVQDSDFRLVVSDDGQGFDPALVDGEKHFGLQLMKERVELAGGVFHVSSQIGRGTQLVARFPSQTNKETN